MTTVAPVLVQTNDKAETITWSAMADTDVGSGASTLPYGEMTVQAIGNATSVKMEGSNDGGTTWSDLDAGVTLTIASSKTPVTRLTNHPLLIRPNVTGGTSTKVVLACAKAFY